MGIDGRGVPVAEHHTAQAVAQVEQIQQKTREHDWTSELDLTTRAATWNDLASVEVHNGVKTPARTSTCLLPGRKTAVILGIWGLDP